MNNTKSPKNVSLKNQLELWLFCALIGAVAGALVWILLKIMAVGTEFLWKWFPGKTSVPYYTILICVACAAIIGIFRKIFGDYPEDLETVMGKVRTEKRYEYKNMLAAITHRKQCRSRSRTYRNHRRFMLLGRRQSEVCQTEYQKLFADWCRSLHECAVSRTSVRYFRSRRKLRGRSCSLNKGFQIIYLRNRAGCRHWYLCRFICTFWCRAFRISIL